MGADRPRNVGSGSKQHHKSRCTATWLCMQLLLFGCCQGFQERLDGLIEAPMPASGQARPFEHLHTRQKQLHHLARTGHRADRPGPFVRGHDTNRRLRWSRVMAAATEASVGRPAPVLLPYPREANAVQRYLSDALTSGAAPYIIPVWFVVVVDPNNVAATNVSVQQLESQIDLLNKAYATGLPGNEHLISESGPYETRSSRITMISAEGPVQFNTVNLNDYVKQFSMAGLGVADSPGSDILDRSGSESGGLDFEFGTAQVNPASQAVLSRDGDRVQQQGSEGDDTKPQVQVLQLGSPGDTNSQSKPHANVVSARKPLAAQEQQQQLQQIHLGADAAATAAASRRQLAAASSNSAGSSQLWRFELKGIRYTSSSMPMCVGSSTELSIKKSWRPKLTKEGGTVPDNTLVIYVSQLTSDRCKGRVAGYSVMFGFGTSPFDLVFWKQYKQEYRDGVVIDPAYLVNNGVQKESGSGAQRGAASGAQLVHEVGHWVGLQHTFEGGCTTESAKTDQVDDTPSEALPTQWGVSLKDASAGCAYRDSCGQLVGPDMYYNYMDYMNLACARTFTPGQQARMLYLFRAVRKS